LTKADISSLLVIGIDVVPLAASAKKAGYQVYAVDYFGDQDLKRVCHENRSIIKQRAGKSCGRISAQFDPKTLLQLTKVLLKKQEMDAALVASGLDDLPRFLSTLNDLVPILGNHPSAIKKIRNKTEFFRELKRLRISHPATATAEDLKAAKEKSRDIGYPVVVKPSKGFGGIGVRKAQNPRELERVFQEVSLLGDEALIQEWISGTPASASIISSINGTVTLTVNEQLLGMHEVSQQEPFGYCGNVVPLSANKVIVERCKKVANRIASHFNLAGSNGIDFVITEKGNPYVIEVNPRFQGTLECVERILGINIVEAHVEACTQGNLLAIRREPSGFCVRLISFAKQRLIVPDLSTFGEVRDIPLPGVIVEKGEPICSIIAKGVNRNSSIRKAKIISECIGKSLRPCPA